ncbi:MAG TPA: FecR family protein [Acidimicrobiales bacterium]|nr:FecR family protein [Acidimicrobiales bacterium]
MTSVDLDCSVHADLATRAITAGEDLPAQFVACLACAERLRALRGLRDLARSDGSLVWSESDAARASRVRARILETVATSAGAPARRSFRQVRPAWSILAFSAAAAAVAVIGLHRGKDVRVPLPSGEVSLGEVRPVGAAQFERVGKAPDEIVRLVEGRIHVEVAHLEPAQRFRVVTSDAVVEVRGTAFDVQASGARLQNVAVERGRVEVRTATTPPTVLGQGSHWAVGESTVTVPPGPAPTPAPVAGPLRVTRPARERSHRDEVAPAAERPVVETEAPAGESVHPATLPAAELQTEVPGSRAPEAKKAPMVPSKPTVPIPAAATQRQEPETVHREREDERAERRERREERRLERLERRR